MNSDTVEPGVKGLNQLSVVFGAPRTHQGSVGRNSISSPGISQLRASPNRWPVAWAATAMLPLLFQPLWVLAKGLAWMGFLTENHRVASVLTHTSDI